MVDFNGHALILQVYNLFTPVVHVVNKMIIESIIGILFSDIICGTKKQIWKNKMITHAKHAAVPPFKL